jgi:hypothetical protein
MQTTLAILYNSFPSVQMLLAERLPVKAGYWVAKLAKKIEPELKTFAEARDKAFTEAGFTLKQNGRAQEWIHADPEIYKRVTGEVDELGKATVEIDMPLLKIETFGDAVVPAVALATLDWAIDQSA